MNNYIKLSKIIEEVSIKNTSNKLTENDLIGININKEFFKSVANVIGTDLSKYKILKKDFFACNLMHIGRDEVLPIACNISNQEYIISPAYLVFKIKDNVDVLPEYLMLYFKNDEVDHELWRRSDSSIRGGISFDDIANLDFEMVSLDKQRDVINSYNLINKKIELNKKKIEKYEKIIRLVYEDSFENYDEESLEYLKDVFNFQEGPGIRNWQNVDQDGINYINIRCIQDNDIVLNSPNMISKEEAFGKYAHFMLNKDDLIISTSGTLGKYAIVREEHLPLCLNTSVIRFTPKNPNAYMFMYCYLTSNDFYSILETEANGAAQVNFGPTHLNKIQLKYPNDNDLLDFENKTRKILDLINNIRTENLKLKSINEKILENM